MKNLSKSFKCLIVEPLTLFAPIGHTHLREAHGKYLEVGWDSLQNMQYALLKGSPKSMMGEEFCTEADDYDARDNRILKISNLISLHDVERIISCMRIALTPNQRCFRSKNLTKVENWGKKKQG